MPLIPSSLPPSPPFEPQQSQTKSENSSEDIALGKFYKSANTSISRASEGAQAGLKEAEDDIRKMESNNNNEHTISQPK